MRIIQDREAGAGPLVRKLATRAAITIGLGIGSCLLATSVQAQIVTACVNVKTGAVTIRSSIAKGSCAKGTEPIVLNPSAAPSPTALKLQTLTVQTINVVDSGNHTVATLGKNSTGNLLTFFDSGQHEALTYGINANETCAGLAFWDNNNIIPGSGIVRESVGECNPVNGASINGTSINGFGLAVWDGVGKLRGGHYLSYDGTNGGAYAIDTNGSTTGFATNQNNQSEGFFAEDLNGKTRGFMGISLDGTTLNEVALFDSTGAFAGDIYQGINAAKTTTGTFLTLENPSGHLAAGETDDANGMAWVLFDANDTVRMLSEIDGANDFIQEFGPSSNLIGHLP
jgi:hypothetical protein